jgi:hypothetical protein
MLYIMLAVCENCHVGKIRDIGLTFWGYAVAGWWPTTALGMRIRGGSQYGESGRRRGDAEFRNKQDIASHECGPVRHAPCPCGGARALAKPQRGSACVPIKAHDAGRDRR